MATFGFMQADTAGTHVANRFVHPGRRQSHSSPPQASQEMMPGFFLALWPGAFLSPHATIDFRPQCVITDIEVWTPAWDVISLDVGFFLGSHALLSFEARRVVVLQDSP